MIPTPARSRLPLARLAAASLCALACACGGGGGGGSKGQPPANLTYSQSPAIYLRGVSVEPNVPTVAGAVASWIVNPSLPAGLALDPASGIVSGTPAALTPAADYTVAASNAFGSAVFDLRLSVVAPARFALCGHIADSTLSAYWIDGEGGLHASGYVLPAPSATMPRAIAAHRSGRFAWVADFEGDSISTYSLDPASGRLVAQAPLPTPSRPAALALHPFAEILY
ncbi:MAG TPA: putative Ig domain-containing protein, partial [Planctomycetota bacterium]|nr:putative Ig domain-containing protein [Planctomycetota bacterium]